MLRRTFFLLFLFFIWTEQATSHIRNIRTFPVPDSLHTWIIQYDLAGYPGDRFRIIFRVAFAETLAFEKIQSAHGDVGSGILPGNGKKILWKSTRGSSYVLNPSLVRLETNPVFLAERSTENMVEVSEGLCFVGDSPPGYGLRVWPKDLWEVKGFLTDKCEVTNSQFAQFLNCGYGDFYHPKMRIVKNKEGKFLPMDGFGDHPAVYVNWYVASTYAHWAGKRLPTEIEWEKAARGTSRKFGAKKGIGFGFMYPWGNENPDSSRANFHRPHPPEFGDTTPVGFFNGQTYNGFQTTDSPSSYGVYDMAGNVWEWTATPYKSFAQNPLVAKDTLYVIRGGSWRDPPIALKVGIRASRKPTDRFNYLGFRCCKSLK